jgi:DNA-binding NarL/FixJ family response regulator
MTTTDFTPSNTIALVDHHPIMRDGLEFVLHMLGYKIALRATNGKDLFDQLQQNPTPGICILDIDMNGYQTATELKAKYPEVRILAFSTGKHELIINRILNCGADAWLEKGADLTTLKNAIDNLHVLS